MKRRGVLLGAMGLVGALGLPAVRPAAAAGSLPPGACGLVMLGGETIAVKREGLALLAGCPSDAEAVWLSVVNRGRGSVVLGDGAAATVAAGKSATFVLLPVVHEDGPRLRVRGSGALGLSVQLLGAFVPLAMERALG